MNYITLPVIAALSYILCEIYKAIFKSENAKRLTPTVSALFGAVLGIIMFITTPEATGCEHVWDAILAGCISGASATGTNQMIKQLFGGKKDDKQ